MHFDVLNVQKVVLPLQHKIFVHSSNNEDQMVVADGRDMKLHLLEHGRREGS